MQFTIEKLIYGGDGLAHQPPLSSEDPGGKAVFMPFVLEGERVEATTAEEKPGFARAILDRVITPSPHRVAPQCPYFYRCGGCQYQHSSYEHQLEIKVAVLRETARRLAHLDLPAELRVHASPPWNYRNRTRMRLRVSPQFALGYNWFGSHDLLPVEHCPISSSLINRAIAEVWELGEAGHISAAIREIEFLADDQDRNLLLILHCDRAHRRELADTAEALKRILPELTGAVAFRRGPTPHRDRQESRDFIALMGEPSLKYSVHSATYRVSASSFFQANRFLIDELIKIAVGEWAGKLALDLYAGLGLFSVPLAHRFERVIAVESSSSSFDDLRFNLPANAQAIRTTTADFLTRTLELRPDLVVVDPPRGGLGLKTARALANLKLAHVVYVACDPATLSRDLRVLVESGLRIEQAHLMDLFPQTFHIESVIHLAR